MSEVHRVVGFAVVALFTIGWVFGLVLRIRRRPAGDWFWRWLAAAQVVVVLQAILGTVLLLVGRRVDSGGTLGGVLHYVYGYLPLLLFVVAHVIARAGNASMIGFDERKPVAPWVPFAWASFICFGLTLRALMTGLGVG
jgi:hypothetical protein